MPQLAQKYGYLTEVPKPVVRGIEVGAMVYFKDYFGKNVMQQAVVGGVVYALYDNYVNNM